MLFTAGERRLLALLALLLLSGFLITALRSLGVLPPPAEIWEEPLSNRESQRWPGEPAGRQGEAPAAGGSPFVDGYLDVNQADSLDLIHLPGIGPVMAGRILALRRADGPFRSVDELQSVKGIGPKRLEQLRDYLTAGDDCRLH